MVALSDLERERMCRLRAEYDLAALRAQVATAEVQAARQRLEAVLGSLCKEHGLGGEVDVDFDRGVLVPRAHRETDSGGMQP